LSQGILGATATREGKVFKSGGYECEVCASAAELFEGLRVPPPATRVYPFLRRDWLVALEESGAAAEENGWQPSHLRVRRAGEVLALIPAYVKTHSMGEFVFDHAIAEFAETRLRLRYYPKLFVGVPFTPATGPRLLTLSEGYPSEVWDFLTVALPELCRRLQLSSVHWLFGPPDEMSGLARGGFGTRVGVQYQFQNRNFHDFDEYLSEFRAKKRAQIRRERRETEGYVFEILTGSELGRVDPGLLFRLYLTTVDKYVWGRRYLNVNFFERVLQTMPESLHVVLARRPGTLGSSGVIAGTFNLLGEQALYGRYWGAFTEVPFLHFETCLYRGIEETITRGLLRFEPGAGGEHKETRGFAPVFTQSSHYFVDPRLHAASLEFFEREHRSLAARFGVPMAEEEG
jgi:uncharacterized protein